MDHEKAIYLRLSPEFGEHRFGPYERGEIRIGSDQQNCAICIGNFGALPIHAKLSIQGKELVLSPSERSAEIFLWRKNKFPEQIVGATVIQVGDAFSIVVENGPKFIVELDELPEEIKEQREQEASRAGVGRSRLTKESMGNEVKRQAFTQLLVFGPMQILQRVRTFIVSGAIYQPRNIIAGAVLLSGWLVGGSMSCRSSKLKSANVVATDKLADCNNDLAFYEDLVKTQNYSLTKAILEITDSQNLADLLKKDKKLMSLVQEKALALSGQDGPDWLVSTTSTRGGYIGQFGAWQSALQSMDDTEIDPETKRLLLWSISETDMSNRGFSLVSNSQGDYQCGRGILQLSYRQGMFLGLSGVQPDAPYKGKASKKDNSARQSLLVKTVENALGPANEDFPESQAVVEGLINAEVDFEQIENRSQQNCFYAQGDSSDARQSPNKLAQSLKKAVGVGRKGLPSSENVLSSGARLAKVYLADVDGMDFRNGNTFKFSGTLSSSLENLNQEGEWVLEQTAKSIARSLVLPCKVALQGTDEARELVGGEEGANLPNPVACLVFDWKIRN